MTQRGISHILRQSAAFLCLLLCLLASRSGLATIAITSPSYDFNITQNISYFEDTEQQYRADDFLDPHLRQQFTPTRAPVLRLGYTDSTLWLRVQVENQTARSTNALVYINQPNIGYLAIYESTPGATDDLDHALEGLGSTRIRWRSEGEANSRPVRKHVAGAQVWGRSRIRRRQNHALIRAPADE